MCAKRVTRLFAIGLFALLVGTTPGCATDPQREAPEPEPGQSAQELIGAFSANNSALNATGALSIMYPNDGAPPVFDMDCSASLIAPQTVITAKHCARRVIDYMSYDYTMVFTLGPNAMNPTRWIEIVDGDTAPGDQGGWHGPPARAAAA